MTSQLIITGCMASALAIMAPVSVAFAGTSEPSKPQLGYFLTKVKLVAQVSQKLNACPDVTENELLPAIETIWSIDATPVADNSKYVNVDASNGFLAKRSTALKLRPDGTLESFDSETSGQGAAALNAVLKVASSVVSPVLGGGGWSAELAMFGGRARPAAATQFVCNNKVLTLLDRISAWSKQIGTLEDKVLIGNATAADIQLLERRKKQRANARDSLMLTSDPVVIDPESTTEAVEIAVSIKSLAYSEWFEIVSPRSGSFDPKALIGIAGFRVKLKSDKSPFLGDGTRYDADHKASPRLIYRRPVYATVSAVPCASIEDGKCQTSETPDYEAASAQTKMPIPQFSGLYSLSTGRGGIFGNRQASAKFDFYGSPLELSYGSDGGAADVASTITAAGEAVSTIRDAELTALEHQIKLEEARKKLSDLRAASSAD
jgi:hypothetical protein